MQLTRRTSALAAVAALTAVSVVAVATITTASNGHTATSVVPVTPYRVLDTRSAVGVPGTDPVGPGATINVRIAGIGPVPTDAVGVVLNITGTQATDETYVTAWPAGLQMPEASTLNLTPGINAPNAATALLGDGGQLSLFNFTGTTHLIADVTGYLIPPPVAEAERLGHRDQRGRPDQLGHKGHQETRDPRATRRRPDTCRSRSVASASGEPPW